VTITFNAHDGIDEMLERARSSEFAVFGDVADEEQCGTGRLRDRTQPLRDVANLGHRSNDARQRVVAHCRY